MRIFGGYASELASQLINFGIPEEIASVFAPVFVYGLAIYIVVALLVLVGKLTKQIRPVHNAKGKAIASLAALFLIYATALIVSWWNMIGPETISSLVKLFLNLPSVLKYGNPVQLVFLAVEMVVAAVLVFALLSVMWVCSLLCKEMFREDIEINGLFKGLILAFYDLCSGFFWLALALAAFSFGVAIILFPVVVVMAAGRNPYSNEVYWDEKEQRYKSY